MKFLKKIKKSLLLTDMIYIMIGLLMALIPGFISNCICYIIGILILLFGASKIIRYIDTKDNGNMATFMLIVGIISAILGLVIILNPESFASLIYILIGIYICILGLSKLKQALDFKANNNKSWYSILISAILLLVLAIIIVFNPFESLTLVIRIIGILFVLNSVYDLYNIYNYTNGFKDFKKDMNDLLN
ncbi:MAG TPA: DUF308 domain-containing protein [Bacilli bacterium]|nr:DUF308 domain-containing protein [Bacilli bacterium]